MKNVRTERSIHTRLIEQLDLQPGAKIKKDLTFSDRILHRRLQKIGPEIYPVEDSVNKYFLFSRYYFSSRFGGASS